MSFNDYEWVAAVVVAHPNHQLIGRTRLQKEIKLLQGLGMPTSFSYSMHYYGPYSEDLQANVGLLQQFGLLTEEEEHNQAGDAYYVFRARTDTELPDVSNFQPAIEILAKSDPIVLELAATYSGFLELGSDEDEAMVRLCRKKGAKCDDGRAELALELLSQLGLRKDSVEA